MDTEAALAALLAEAAGTELQSDNVELEALSKQLAAATESPMNIIADDTDNASAYISGKQPSATAATQPTRAATVSSAFALTLNQYLGQHPAMMLNHSKTLTVYQACVDYPEVGDAALASSPVVEEKVRYQQWIGICQEALELERLAAVYKDPTAALNASLTRLHETAALPAASPTSASGDYFNTKGMPSNLKPSEWAAAVLDNPLSRSTYYLAYGPLFSCDSHTATMPLEAKKAIDEAPTSSASPSSLGLSHTISRSEAWTSAAARVARDVYDRQAWQALLATIRLVPLHHVRHIWQAFCFYFPTCGPVIEHYLTLEIALLTGASDGAAKYGSGNLDGLRYSDFTPFHQLNGIKDTDDQAASENNFKAVLRVANAFYRHLPVCSSPSLYELYIKFALNFVPTTDLLLGTSIFAALDKHVGHLPTSNDLWLLFIRVVLALERRVGANGLWQLFISWGGAQPGEDRTPDNKAKSGLDLARKLYLRALCTPLVGYETTRDCFSRINPADFKLMGTVERTINSAKRTFEDGWKLWAGMFYGAYTPAMPTLPPLMVPLGGPISINMSNFGVVGENDMTFTSLAEGSDASGRPAGSATVPYFPIPCGRRDIGAQLAEDERTANAFMTASGDKGFDTSGHATSSGLSCIAPEFRSNYDADGIRSDVAHWQLWNQIISYEQEANRLGASLAKYATRVRQFLQWRVSQFPHHAAAHLDLVKYLLEGNPTQADRTLRARDAMEFALTVLPDSKVLVAEFGRLLRADFADDIKGHSLFRSAVERAKTRLALLRQVPLAAPLGANFLSTKFSDVLSDLSSPSTQRTAVSMLSEANLLQHAKLLSYARAQANESLSVTQSLMTWYSLWLRWAQRSFMADGRHHMRLVAKHAFDETNIVLVTIQEVQRLYKGLSLPFFVDPQRPSDGSGESCGAMRPNGALADLLALLTSSGNSAVEADTCIQGRGAGGSIVFSPRHHFASLNALIKQWCTTEALQLQAPDNAFTIFSGWGTYLRSMVDNTAARQWSPLDCGVDESFFAAAHQLLQCRPEDKQRIFGVVKSLVATLDDTDGAHAKECALRLLARFDPKHESPNDVTSLAYGPLADPSSSSNVLLELAKRWRSSVLAYDAASPDFATAATPLAGPLAHCDSTLDRAIYTDRNSTTAAAAERLEKAVASSFTVPSLTPFNSIANPSIFIESYLDTSDDQAGLGAAAQVTDLDHDDNATSEATAAAKRKRDILLGLESAEDQLAQSPFTWWAPSRNMKATPRVFAGLTDLAAAIPSTVPFVGQGILDLVRSQSVAEHAANEENYAGYNAGSNRGAASRADVVNLAVLSLLDRVGLSQLSTAMDTFALPLPLHRFNTTSASDASTKAAGSLPPHQVTANSSANVSLDAYTATLVSASDIGYDEVPAPLDGKGWMSYNLTENTKYTQQQRALRQHHQRGRGGRGGRGRGADRGRGSRGRGWHNAPSDRRSLLTLADDEEKAQERGEGDDLDFESEDDEVMTEANDRSQSAKLGDGVYNQQRTLSQFTARTFAVANNPFHRSLEFSMDNLSLMMATRRERAEADAEDGKRQSEEAERTRLREDRDKRLRSEQVYAAPMDTPSAIMAAHSRQQRAMAAANAAPIKGVQQTALQTAIKTRRRIATAISSKSYPVADAWMHVAAATEARSQSTGRAPSGDPNPHEDKGYAASIHHQHAVERGNSDYASLHYLIQRLPRHTLSTAITEAEATTGASAYSADSILKILQDIPSLRANEANL